MGLKSWEEMRAEESVGGLGVVSDIDFVAAPFLRAGIFMETVVY